jgi:Na+/proline symporter
MMPFAGIFLFAVLWKRINRAGVLACMAAVVTLCPVMMLNNERHFLPLLDHPLLRPWLHGAMLMSAICMLVLVGVSLVTPPPPAAKLVNTTVAGLWGKNAATAANGQAMWQAVAWYRDYRLWLSIVSGGTAIAWYIMR